MDIVNILILLFFLLLLLSLGLAGISLAPWLPTKRKDFNRILRLSQLKPGQNFYDIGCGDGRICFFIYKNTRSNVTGIEMAWPFYIFCRIKKWWLGFRRVEEAEKRRLEFKCKDLFNHDLSQAEVVFVFGIPGSIKRRLKQKLEKELKPGAKVISYSFSFPGWEHKLKLDRPENNRIPIFVYQL